MRIYYYLFDKSIYNYTATEDGVEIRRNDGKDIDFEGYIEPLVFDEDQYNCILKFEGKERAEEYKNTCNPKVHFIWSDNYHIIDDDYYLENHLGVDVFLVVEYN